MKCIVCESTNVEVAFILKNGPRYAQKLLNTQDEKGGGRFDVTLYKCKDCGMVQIDPAGLEHDEYFEDYLMSRSCTELYVQYDNELADTLQAKYGIQGKKIVEIGCGDGFFGELLIQRGAQVSAIEPPDRVGYYTAKTLVEVMERNNFHVTEVFHGAEGEYVGAYVVYEGQKDGLLKDFKHEFEAFNKEFGRLMDSYRAAGKKVAAWGAGAKGVTIFSFSGMDSGSIAYVVDKDNFKWNKFLPGSRLPVVAPDTVREKPVDAMIITGVMFYKEITRQLVRDYGFSGDIILLSPMPHVLPQEELKRLLAS